MGDHFVLLVDRLLTESTLEATIESGNRVQIDQATDIPLQTEADGDVRQKRDCSEGSFGGKLVECRYCHDEDQDCNLETPCSCCGSLKYAHRKCVQRWCNEKGDTICEICLQQFTPGYIAPPQLFHYGGVPMNFRGNWGISRQDINNPQFLAMVSPDHSYSDPSYDDYESPSARNVLYCRIVAVIFMVLLVLRHALPIILSGDEYTFTVFALLLLRIAGILLPVYVMLQALSVFHRRRRPLQP